MIEQLKELGIEQQYQTKEVEKALKTVKRISPPGGFQPLRFFSFHFFILI
jgi:hypothetical protein